MKHELEYLKRLKKGYKVSRKTKKRLLGLKMSKKDLKMRLSNVVITRDERGSVIDISDEFCPRCGCELSKSTGNMAEHPEIWVNVYCVRCDFLVGAADNSPFTHALEWKDNNYEIDF